MFLHKMRTKIVPGVLLITLLAGLTGCGQQDLVETGNEDNGAIEIGVTFDSLVIERWERDRDVFVAKARELGADVNVQNANGDVEAQIAQIEYFVEKKVDAIVIVATDCDALSDVVAKAKKAGVKVVSYDRLISNANTDLFISFDNYRVGELMGNAIASQTQRQGEILMINGSHTDTNVPEVMKGFQDSIEGTNIKIVETDFCAGWKPEYAFDYVSEYLNENPDNPPAAIMCGNDSLAGQAVKALSERKLAGAVVVTGQDADVEACQRIVEGTQYMTVYKPVEKLAQKAAEMTIELITHGKVENTDSINDGSNDIPFVKLAPVQVTAANMDEVIIGSFHQRNEVYLNIE